MLAYKRQQDSKYKVLLVAYKDVDEKLESELAHYFISSIKDRKGIKENITVSGIDCCGMSFRTCLYHNWFKETILEKLKKGYKIGIVETPKSYGDKDENRLKQLDQTCGDKVLIVATGEL